jgi:hypothetical protein
MPGARTELIAVLASAVLVFAACGGDADESPMPRPVREASTPRSATVMPRIAPVRDARGRLLPSDVQVAGLTLPRGLEAVREEGGEHVYRSEESIDALLAYFGPRLFTARVEAVGTGAIYRHARPTEVPDAPVFLDVSVLPASGNGSRVHVYELPTEAEGRGRPARAPDYRMLD